MVSAQVPWWSAGKVWLTAAFWFWNATGVLIGAAMMSAGNILGGFVILLFFGLVFAGGRWALLRERMGVGDVSVAGLHDDDRITRQIKALGALDTFGTRKEIRYLPEIIQADECILALSSGLMDGNTWLIVCTDRRLVFLDKGFLYGLSQTDIPLERISSIKHKIGIIFGEITVWDGATEMEIKNLLKAHVPPFLAALNQARKGLSGGQAGGSSTVGVETNNDILTQLERLSSLLEKGMITQDEFSSQKLRLLSGGD